MIDPVPQPDRAILMTGRHDAAVAVERHAVDSASMAVQVRHQVGAVLQRREQTAPGFAPGLRLIGHLGCLETEQQGQIKRIVQPSRPGGQIPRGGQTDLLLLVTDGDGYPGE